MDFEKLNFPRKSRSSHCYCQKNYCDPLTNINQQNGEHRFIKIRNESGNLKPSCERIPFSGPNSRCTSKVSFQNNTNFIPNDIEPPIRYLPEPINPNLTERRDWYEQSKGSFQVLPKLRPSQNILPAKTEYFLDNLVQNKINDINKFRLENSSECFSALSKHSIGKRLGLFDEKDDGHICEFGYRLNKRGLLEPIELSDNGKLICTICRKVADKLPIENGIAPIGKSQQMHKIVLEINDNKNFETNIKDRKNQIPRIYKKKLVPENSLALLYQKTY